MFVGHYAASLALKRFETRASLGFLFLAVQFVDILFFPLVVLGLERINLIENYTQSTHFELEYMPYTHSLVASFLWAGLAYVLFRLLRKGEGKRSIALVMALAVLSHWFLDLIVHTPDLPLLGDTSLKLGLGLWHNAMATYVLEAVLLLIGLWLYLGSTTATSPIGKYGTTVFVSFLLLVNMSNLFGPPMGDSKVALVLSALIAYFLFAGVAFWLDSKRA